MNYAIPHPTCWNPSTNCYEHRCFRPSGRVCIDCGAMAGTIWNPELCVWCDMKRTEKLLQRRTTAP